MSFEDACFTFEGPEGGRRHILVYLGNSHRESKVLEYLIGPAQILGAEVVKKKEESRTNIAKECRRGKL